MNTIDSLGDFATFAKLVDGTITEYIDDAIITISNQHFLSYIDELVRVDLPALVSITSDGYALYRNPKLETVNVPNLKEFGRYTFGYCEKLIAISDLNNCLKIPQNAFDHCSSLPRIASNSVLDIESRAFFDCTSLANVDFPSAKSVYTYAFQGCTALTKIKLQSATFIAEGAFATCSSLKSVTLPSCTQINKYVFSQLTNIESIAIGNDSSDKVAYLGGALSSNGTLSKLSIYVPDALVEDYKSATNWSTYADKIKPLSELPAEEEET